MTRTASTAIKSAIVAITVALSAIAAPAYAGGYISFDVQPRNAEEAAAMRAGLGIYAIANGIKNGSIKQKGFGNVAGLLQNGSGNLGIVHQQGNGHNGTLVQNGNGNSYGLFQFGKNSDGHVVQNGNGGTGATFQWGW